MLIAFGVTGAARGVSQLTFRYFGLRGVRVIRMFMQQVPAPIVREQVYQDTGKTEFGTIYLHSAQQRIRLCTQ